MRCPFCETGSMRPVDPETARIRQCASCGAVWFDSGEIRALIEGRFPGSGELAGEGNLPAYGQKKTSLRISDAWEKASSCFCPQCSGSLTVLDFHSAGIPVFHCRACGGMLVTRDAVVELAGEFRVYRQRTAVAASVGGLLAGLSYGSGEKGKAGCPFCKTGLLRPVDSGRTQIDQCASCGAAWFDSGNIRELIAGRFPLAADPKKESGSFVTGKENAFARMSQAWKQSVSLSCPRCVSPLTVLDFHNIGIPVFRCSKCGGILVTRDAAEELAGEFRFNRKHAEMLASMGKSLADLTQRRIDIESLPSKGVPGEFPVRRRGPADPVDLISIAPSVIAAMVPVVIPLEDGVKRERPGSHPVVTFGFLVLVTVIYLFCLFGIAGMDEYKAFIALPSGAGFLGVPASALLLAPFFHGGFFSFVVNGLFLFVLGGNVENRMGRVRVFLFYLVCAVTAGIAHVLWGKAGAPAALGSAGAVAGLLGAYTVFFPQAPITVYKAGEIVSLPVYLFVCVWVAAQFLWGWEFPWEWGPWISVLNPAPYSLAGNLGGFVAGIAGAALWRSMES